MRRILCIVLTLIMLVSLCACSKSGTVTDEGKLEVIATVFPAYDFARTVAGDMANVQMLLPAGGEAHEFEPTPKDIIRISECDVFVYVGGESDAWVTSILEGIDTSKVSIVRMSDAVDMLDEENIEGMSEHHGHNEHNKDEHVWTSPVNAIKIVEHITTAFCKKDADNKQIYEENANAYIEKLTALDLEFENICKNAKRKTVVFGDRFPMLYFAKEYNLDYYAAFPGCSAQSEPSAATVAFLIDKVRNEQIPVVFHIEFSNQYIADTICEDTGAKKLLFHSCHNVTKDEIESGVTYLSLMEGNLETLREALN